MLAAIYVKRARYHQKTVRFSRAFPPWRDAAGCRAITAAKFCGAVVMPNTEPPIDYDNTSG